MTDLGGMLVRARTGLAVVCALTASALLWAGIPTPAFAAQATETASLSAPDQRHGEGTSLPRMLSQGDAALYRDIFDLQRDGQWKKADRLIDRLDDRMLLGHVLFQRYMHPTRYRSKYMELKRWLDEYADHPAAGRVYKLALRRRPANYKHPTKPRLADLPWQDTYSRNAGAESDAETPSRKTVTPAQAAGKSRAQRRQIRRMQRQVRRWVQRGNVTFALRELDTGRNRKLFDKVSFARSLGVITRGYFRYHKDEKAMKVAARAAEMAGDKAPMADWWGGLAAWRQGEYARAAAHFDRLSGSDSASAWNQAAGGFWASRAYLVGGEPTRVSAMLKRAARHPRTFYGLMATRALGHAPAFDWDLPAGGVAERELLMRLPAARRALALIEAGQHALADAELRLFAGSLPPAMAYGFLELADAGGLADLAWRVGSAEYKRSGTLLDAALYPLPGWTPEGGFHIDRALLYGFVRQESRFRVQAKSHAGARGLMQIMPATAGWIEGVRYRGAKRAELFDPARNLAIGQRYIRILLDDPEIAGNMFYMLVGYNGGPGNLRKWRGKIDYDDDPLLFIESIPSRETRNYVERVMTNFWIYRHRMGQPTPTLDALIGGRWPGYVALDGSGTNAARAQADTTQ